MQCAYSLSQEHNFVVYEQDCEQESVKVEQKLLGLKNEAKNQKNLQFSERPLETK